ncbi:MAG: hypothetical protein ILO42_06565 [Clostridia bacterium]|nr:hypothetical protein [Clostridia bacterium]
MAFGKSYYNEDHKLVRYGIKSFFRDLFRFLACFFSFSNIKHAFREVISDARGYAAFFAALTVAQSFFWMIKTEQTGYEAAAIEAADSCEYNLVIEGYTDEEWTRIFNSAIRIANTKTEAERGYASVSPKDYYGTSGDGRVRVFVRLTDDSEASCLRFLKRYGLGGTAVDRSFVGEEVSYSYGERTSVHIRLEQRRKTSNFVCFLAIFVAAFVITLIFRIRSDQFRFRYGIYMAFGADFSKLLETVGWEVLAVAALTYIPAMALGIGLCAALGGKIVFSGIIGSLLPAAGWIILAVIMGVFPSARRIARATPVSLIAAADNSNYVTSPRKSFRIFGKKFPLEYELFGIWRFRKYYIGVLAAASCFSVLFYTGGFVAGLAAERARADLPQFKVESPDRGIDYDVLEEISEMDGVGAVVWSDSVSATLISAYVGMTPEASGAIYGRTVADGDLVCDNLVRFASYSALLEKNAREFGLWTVDGDVSTITADGNDVAVTVSVNGKKALNIKPGDTLTLALAVRFEGGINFASLDHRTVLTDLLERGVFEYYDVRVAAVIDNGDADEKFTVYLPDGLFAGITGREPLVTEADVYLERDAGVADAERLRNRISDLVSHYWGTGVTDTGRAGEKQSDSVSPAPALMRSAALALLLLSVPVWVFSQITFFRKRKLEFYMLRSLGGRPSALRSLCLTSGWMTALPAGLIPGAAGMALSAALFELINVKLPSYGFGEGIRYTYDPGFLMVAVGILIPAAAAFFSSAAAGLAAGRTSPAGGKTRSK